MQLQDGRGIDNKTYSIACLEEAGICLLRCSEGKALKASQQWRYRSGLDGYLVPISPNNQSNLAVLLDSHVNNAWAWSIAANGVAF